MTDVEVPVLPGKIHFSIFQFLYLFRVAFSERSVIFGHLYYFNLYFWIHVFSVVETEIGTELVSQP